MLYNPNQENIITDNNTKIVIKYCDDEGNPVFTAKEIFKNEPKILIYPYFVNRRTNLVSQGKIKTLEFRGWNRLEDLPNDFKKKRGNNVYYGINSYRLKQLTYFLNPKFPELNKMIFGLNSRNRFSTKTIRLNWTDAENILKQITKEKNYFDKNRKLLINNSLSQITNSYTKNIRDLHYGELKFFVDKFESFEKATEFDIEALSRLIGQLPKNKISVTENFIKTKEKINIAYIEEIIDEFEKLIKVQSDNEKKWQEFFEKHSWIFSHLFPYDVILKQREAYVGGKTIENKDGKVVDFLYQNGFKDNYALIEIKTHKKDLLKSKAYRGTDVFSMSDDLSGGINQCLDQKDVFLKDFGKDLKPIDPKTILVIGLKSALTKNQAKCFELLRANQKNVDILTFDELQSKMKGLLNVMTK